MRFAAVLPALFLFSAAAFAQGDPDNPYRPTPQQMLERVDGATIQQLAVLNAKLARNPNDQVALTNRGALALHAATESRYGFFWIQGAAKDLEQAVRLNPNDFYARHNYAMACLQAGDVNPTQPVMHLAIVHFTKALELNPRSARSWMGRGWAYLMLGDEARAQPDFQKALQLDPGLRDQLEKEADSIRVKRAQLAGVPAMLHRMGSYIVEQRARTASECSSYKGYWTGSECRVSMALATGPIAPGGGQSVR